MNNIINLFTRVSLICLLALSVDMASAQEQKGIIVVANTESDITLSKQEVKSLFMGSYIGHDLTAVVLPTSHYTRVEFNTIVIGLTEDRIQSYWAQMRFSGRKMPPKQLQTEQSIITHLLSNKGATSYLPADTEVPDNLTIIYSSK